MSLLARAFDTATSQEVFTPFPEGGGLVYLTESLISAAPNATVPVVRLSPNVAETNADFAISPKETGAVLAHVPDNLVSGGNKRGNYAVDLQVARSVNTHVASGAFSVISGGQRNTASGQDSAVGGGRGNSASATSSAVIGGHDNIASGPSSCAGGFTAQATGEASWALGSNVYATVLLGMATGHRSVADRYGMYARASGYFASNGDAQTAHFVLRNKTTDDTPTELFLDGAAACLTISSGKIVAFFIQVQGVKSDGLDAACFHRIIQLKNVSGTTSALFPAQVVGTDYAPTTSVTVEANDTNDALRILANGISGETWRWTATIIATETGIGA